MTLLDPRFEAPQIGNLPPLPEYAAEAVDPALIAAPNTAELADLYISVGGDGLPLALAGLRNGHKRHEIGAQWAEISATMTPDERRRAASQHFSQYLDLSSTGAEVKPGYPGQSTLDYARDVLYRQLRRPARLEDTDVRLRTRYDYYVPGTRFDDSFPADNIQVAWALLADGNIRGSLETVANIQHDTMRFGYAPNLSKIGMLRQQTPVDSFAIESYRGLYGDQVLTHFAPALERNIAFMNSGKDKLAHIPLTGHGAHRRIVRLPGGLHAYRNWDDTPVDFKNRSVIRIESAEKDRELGERVIAGVRDTDEKAHLYIKAQVSLAAGAESWQDMSDYQLEDRINLETIRTTEICTSWLQAAAAHKIKSAALARELAGDYRGAEMYWTQFNELKTVVNTLMIRPIDETHAYFTDILQEGTQTGALNAAQMLPLLVGSDFVSYKNARMTINTMRDELLGDYGLGTSNVEGCAEQWSGKHRNWPSLAAFARLCAMEQAQEAKRRNIPGESPEPFIEFAEEIDAAMTRGIEAWYGEHHTLPERINGDNPREVALGGEYCSVEDGKKPQPQIGFGMTAGAYIVAKTMPVRQIFEHTEARGGSWLSQSFAVHLGRSAIALV